MALSGVRIDGFVAGCGLLCGRFGCGHYFTYSGTGELVTSSCGLRAPRCALWGVGSFPLCKRCLRKHAPPADTRTFIEAAREARSDG